jgi:hypothetical protein
MIMSRSSKPEEYMILDKKRLILTVVTIAAILLLFVLVGCSTEQRAVKRESERQTSEDLGLSINLRYVSENELEDTFGKKDNPFLSPPSAFGMNQSMVFELEMTPEKKFRGPFTVELKRIELQFGGINTDPTNQFHLISLWEFRLQRENAYRGWSMGKVRSRIRKSLLPNKFIIHKNKAMKGYILFTGSFPRYGDAVIYVPVMREGEGIVKNFKLDFSF